MEYINAQCTQCNLCLGGKVLLFYFISISISFAIMFSLLLFSLVSSCLFGWRLFCGLYWFSVYVYVFVFVIALMSKYVYSYSSLTYPLLIGFIHTIYHILNFQFVSNSISIFTNFCVCCILYLCVVVYMYVYRDGMFVSVCVYFITTFHLLLHTEQQSMLNFIAHPILNIIEK